LTLDRSPTSFDILWFKFAKISTEIPKNIFYSIVAGDAAFGLFYGAEGHLQIGWSLDRSRSVGKAESARDRYDPNCWQDTDWIEKFAAAAPPDLAAQLRQRSISELERPILLSVTVGLCPRWHLPGVLLLGDAAHPMSPIRAQGINMALRDAVVAANYLAPILKDESIEALDNALTKIQAAREPEIVRIQQLQRAEFGQAELLKNFPPLRMAVSTLAPKLPPLQSRLRRSWIDRQRQMRQGIKGGLLEI
jgi:2-polyprenyl-6-methoxyphenol hydroxylase-like FAD-dependent oxidoreductase